MLTHAGADALRELSPESVQLLVRAQLNPEFDRVGICLGHHSPDDDLVAGHAQGSRDLASDYLAYRGQVPRLPQVVDENHAAAMLASPAVMASASSPVLDALYHGRIDEAERLVNELGEERLTIHEAAAMGLTTRLEAILAEDPSQVNAWASDGFQPLQLAAFFGRREAVNLLLARGGDVRSAAQNSFKVTALHAALAGPAPDVAPTLIAAGADVNAVQQDGVTPLHEAAANGQLGLVRLLLEHGANRQATDARGRTAADFAREAGHGGIESLLS